MLNQAQREAFHRDGFLIGLPLLEPGQAAQICRHLTRGQKTARLLQAVACSPRLLSCVQDVLGPDVLLRNIDVFVKIPGSVQVTDWHVDTTTAPREAEGMLNAWVALTEARVHSGCLQYLPGCHRRTLPGEGEGPEMLTISKKNRATLPLGRAVHAELAAGQVALHAFRTPHCSGPNQTQSPRIGLAIRYLSARLSTENAECGQATLVSGKPRGWVLRPRCPVLWNVQRETQMAGVVPR
jgi:ectoine hydroxylase-related dioxygenase (phytanoyl-CoA dioxygenase family)